MSRRRMGWFRRLGRLVVWTMIILVVAVAALLLLQPTVSLDFLAPRAEQILSRLLGQPATATGLRCQVGLHPRFAVDRIQTHPAEPVLLDASALAVTVSLLSAVQGVVRFEDIAIDAIDLHIPARQDRPPSPGQPDEASIPLRIPPLGFDAIRIDRANITVGRTTGEDETIVLSQLSASAPVFGSTRVDFQTDGLGRQAEIRMEGGNLNHLFRTPLTWPLRVRCTTDSGSVALDASIAGFPSLKGIRVLLAATLQDVRLGKMLSEKMQVDVASAEIHARWEGVSLAEMLASGALQARVEGGQIRLDRRRGKTTDIEVAHAMATWRAGQPLILSATGDILAETVLLRAEVGPQAERVPLEVRVSGLGAQLVASGHWGRQADAPGLRELKVDLWGEHAGDLAAWTGLAADATLPYGIAATYHATPDAATVYITEAFMGSTRMTGEVEIPSADTPGRVPQIGLAFGRLDMVELATLSPERSLTVREEDAAAAAGRRRLQFDVPILPSGLTLPSAEVLLRVDQLHVVDAEISDVNIHLTFQDGWMVQSPFTLKMAQAEWAGECFFDAREDVPLLGGELAATNVVLNDLVAYLGKDMGLEVVADRVATTVAFHGSSLGEMSKQSMITLEAANARARLPGSAGHPPREIQIPTLQLSKEGDDDALLLAGVMRELGQEFEWQLRTRVAQPSEDSGRARRLNLDGMLRLGQTELQVEGTCSLPLSDLNLDLALQLAAPELAGLIALIGLDWIPRGPLEARGHWRSNAGVIAVSDLSVELNQSRFEGDVRVENSPEKISWQVEGNCPVLWIDDLGMEGETHATAEASRESDAPDAAARPVYGDLTIGAAEIHFLGTALGAGSIHLKQSPGRILVHPIQLEGPDIFGKVVMDRNAPGPEEPTQLQLVATSSNLPFKVLGLIEPHLAQSKGGLYADVDLTTSAREGDVSLLGSLQGEAGFATFPEDVRSKYLDYWGVGIIHSLGMTLTGTGETKVECIAGRLRFDQGVARPQALYIDTSRMRVRVTGSIDFNRGTLDLDLKPRPKKPAFLSLATPVRVTGSIANPHIKITASGLLGTLSRLYLGVVTYVGSLFRDELPEHDFEGYMKMMNGQNP